MLPVREEAAVRRRVFLAPEGLYCAPDAAIVTTVLGSCVAVCLWDRWQRFGGINHFMLPRHGAEPASARYGDIAIPRLVGEMRSWGARPSDLEAKIFGGAAVLAGASQRRTVGAENVRLALDLVRGMGIPVTGQRTGGARGLHLRFDTETGEVLVRPLAAQFDATDDVVCLGGA